MAALSFDDALAKLAKVTWRGPNDATARCPAHADRTPSLSVTRGKNGDAVFHCFAGCDWRDVSAALDDSRRGVFTPTRSAATRQRLSKLPGLVCFSPLSGHWTESARTDRCWLSLVLDRAEQRRCLICTQTIPMAGFIRSTKVSFILLGSFATTYAGRTAKISNAYSIACVRGPSIGGTS